jgi:hypothetical protein
MIWVTWRSHRLVLLLLIAVLAGLAVWMAFVAHTFDVASMLQRANRCPIAYGGQRSYCTGNQADALIIIYILFALPCVLGLTMGVPLVAGEFHNDSNRLAWTQTISRTKWFVTKWLLVGIGLLVISALFQVVVNWWFGSLNLQILGVPFGHGMAYDRIQPALFQVTGVVPIAYTLFAFSLGVALGAVIRRTPWAIVVAVLAYGAAAVVMVVTVRPQLMPQTFVPSGAQSWATEYASGSAPAFQEPWDLGSGYRYEPGYRPPVGAPSADTVGQTCESLDNGSSVAPYHHCMTRHHLQEGELYQPADDYWPLQWKEAAIYGGATIVLLGLGLWSVRRWRS